MERRYAPGRIETPKPIDTSRTISVDLHWPILGWDFFFCRERWDLRKGALAIGPDGVRASANIQGFVPWRAVSMVEWHFDADWGPFVLLHIIPEFKDKLEANSFHFSGESVVLPVQDYDIDSRKLYEICLAYFEQAQRNFSRVDLR